MPFSKKSKGEFYFDDLDLDILKIFTDLNGEALGGWMMMKQLFPNAKSQSEQTKAYDKMKSRIKSLSKIGVIKIKERKDGTPIWEVTEGQVCFKKIKMPNGIKKFVAALVNDSWQIMQIS